MLKKVARRIHGLLPESALKRKMTALAYRGMYRNQIQECRFDRNVFEVLLKNGIRVRSVREFDPEPLVSEIYSLKLESGAIALDLGGHYGVVSVYLASLVGKSGRVISFEADKTNYEILRQNLELNGVENVEAIPLGVSDRSGILEFHSGGSYTSSFHETDYVEKNLSKYKTTKIPVVTLDERLFDLDRLDFVKMDIEGSEIEAIKGGKRLLSRFLPHLMIETHVVSGQSTADEVIALLKEIGYRSIQKKADSDVEMPTILAEKA